MGHSRFGRGAVEDVCELSFGEGSNKGEADGRLSQEALVLGTEIDRAYISGIERGLRNPSLDLIVKLAARPQRTPGELLAGPERKTRR